MFIISPFLGRPPSLSCLVKCYHCVFAGLPSLVNCSAKTSRSTRRLVSVFFSSFLHSSFSKPFIFAAQGFANYFFLCLIYGTILACKSTYENGLINVIRSRGWKYALLALIDVEANYLVVRAYQYTNLTSVQVCS